MEWVYIYKDNEDGRILYVGRAGNNRACKDRIHAHKREEWTWGKSMHLYFCPCRNRAESEALETEYIHRFAPSINKDKKSWGGLLEDIPPLNALPNMDAGCAVGLGGALITGLDAAEKKLHELYGNLGY